MTQSTFQHSVYTTFTFVPVEYYDKAALYVALLPSEHWGATSSRRPRAFSVSDLESDGSRVSNLTRLPRSSDCLLLCFLPSPRSRSLQKHFETDCENSSLIGTSTEHVAKYVSALRVHYLHFLSLAKRPVVHCSAKWSRSSSGHRGLPPRVTRLAGLGSHVLTAEL